MRARVYSFLLFLVASCDNPLLIDQVCNNEEFLDISTEQITDSTSIDLNDNHPATVLMRKRAWQMGMIEWTPLREVVLNNGVMLDANKKVTGIPYSSVKELDKFVGQEVSFHTFMTAVHNPKSVLYTERVNLPPYNGTNCALFYGTVCSMAVNYALGLERPYVADMYPTLPFFQKVTHQDLSYAVPGDVIWTKGHVVLITNVWRDDLGNMEKLEILESAGRGTSIKTYSLDQLINRWKNFNWLLLRYKELNSLVSYEICPYVQVLDDPYEDVIYNDKLCLNRGDKASYRTGENVVLNVLTDSFKSVALFRSGVLYCVRSLCGCADIVFDSLPPGSYEAILTKGRTKSAPVSFEVLDTNVSVKKAGKMIQISFSSINSVPEYVVICSRNGGRYSIIDITNDDLLKGYLEVLIDHPNNNLFAKVFFKGKYGRVSNKILPIE